METITIIIVVVVVVVVVKVLVFVDYMWYTILCLPSSPGNTLDVHVCCYAVQCTMCLLYNVHCTIYII